MKCCKDDIEIYTNFITKFRNQILQKEIEIKRHLELIQKYTIYVKQLKLLAHTKTLFEYLTTKICYCTQSQLRRE
jgi:hypothetical protein